MLFHPLIPWDFHPIYASMDTCNVAIENIENIWWWWWSSQKGVEIWKILRICAFAVCLWVHLSKYSFTVMCIDRCTSKVDFWINRKCSIENAFWFYHTHWCLPPFLCKFSQSICKFAFKRDQNNEKITKRSQWMNRLRKGTRHNIIMEKICCV